MSSYPVRGWIENVDTPAVKVLQAPDSLARVIGFVLKGQRFALLVKSNKWYGIDFRGVLGWVGSDRVVESNGRTVSSESLSFPQQGNFVRATTGTFQHPGSSHNNPEIDTAAVRAGYDREIAFGNDRQLGKGDHGQQASPLERALASLLFAFLKRMPSLKVVIDNLEVPQTEDAFATADLSSDTTSRYITIDANYLPVLAEVDPGAPALGLARAGERYRLLREGVRWSRIEFGDTAGWVERRHTKPWTPPSSRAVWQKVPLYALVVLAGVGLMAILILAALAVGGFLIVKKIRRVIAAKSSGEKKTCLVLAQNTKNIEEVFENRLTTLDKCFTDAGFAVHRAADLLAARNILARHGCDVICIDWEAVPNMQDTLQRLLSLSDSGTNPVVIVYNVPDPHGAEKSMAVGRVAFLGITFSDRDLFKIITSAAAGKEKAPMTAGSIESHALEGDIAGGHLSDVLQFIEMGRKSGSLLIDKDGQPQAMIGFEHGSIVYAVAGSVAGATAVFEVLDMSGGHFRFIAGATPTTKNMHASALGLLMEWTRRKDEAARH